MKILVINNVYPDVDHPTPFIFVHQQVKALINNGIEVRVLDIDLRSYRWKRKWGVYKDIFEGVVVYRFSFPFVTRKLRKIGQFLNSWIGKYMAKYIISEWGKIDIVHAHFGYGAGNAGAAIKKKYRVPLVITEHSSAVLTSKTAKEIPEFMKAYFNADIVICVSDALRKKIESYGIKNVITISNVVNSEVFRPLEIAKNKTFTIICVGHLIDNKNQQFLIKIFSEVIKKMDAFLIIIGNGPNKEHLRELAHKLGCYENVEFIDSVENEKLPEFYNKSHCFVMPSLYETFGMVYAEAIACGIPAISYSNGGVNDIINKENGIVVDELNTDKFVNAILRVKATKYDKDKLNNSIISRFGSEIFTKKILEVYDDIRN